jgi:DNA-binding transcriptional LysR family regulator
LLRTTRSVSLTDAAQPYFLTCCRLLEELDEANRRMSLQQGVNGGRLRLAVHPAIVNEAFSRLLRRYRSMAPHVSLVVSVEDGAVSLFDGRFDIAILPSHRVEQATVIRRALTGSPSILVASPDYLGEYGFPESASDLAAHFLLVDRGAKRKSPDAMELLESGRKVSVPMMSSMQGDEVLLRSAALSGTGIAVLPEAMVREDIGTGKLVHVLPECTATDCHTEMCLFYAHRELQPARLRTFVDFCIGFFRAADSCSNATLDFATVP